MKCCICVAGSQTMMTVWSAFTTALPGGPAWTAGAGEGSDQADSDD